MAIRSSVGGSSTAGTSDSGTVVAAQEDAARFLTQATFGPTLAEVDRMVGTTYETWTDEQIQIPTSLQLPKLQALPVMPQQSDRADARRITSCSLSPPCPLAIVAKRQSKSYLAHNRAGT